MEKQKSPIGSLASAFNACQGSNSAENLFEGLKKLLLISIYLQWSHYRFDNLCPIHGGHSGKSFKFDDARGRWHCWVCRKWGDVVQLHWYLKNRGIPVHKQTTLTECRDELQALWDQGEFTKLKPIACNTALLPAKQHSRRTPTDWYNEVKANFVDLDKLHKRVKEQLPLDQIAQIESRYRHITYERLLKRCKIPTREPCEFLPLLFPGDPSLVIGKYIEAKRVFKLSRYRKPSILSFIVPNIMKEDGSRCRLDVVKRLYTIVEFDCFKDFPDPDRLDKQCRLIWHLAQEPVFNGSGSASGSKRSRRNDDRLNPTLVLMLFSGGKSVHGWFDVQGWRESWIYTFMRKAVSLGADPAPYKPEQPVRLPQGFNYKEESRQKVIYWNPQLNLHQVQTGNQKTLA